MMKLFRSYATSAYANNITLLFAELMGMYFIAFVMLMRLNVRPEYRRTIDAVLGQLEFSFFHRWFDIIFVISAAVSAATLFLQHTSVTAHRRQLAAEAGMGGAVGIGFE